MKHEMRREAYPARLLDGQTMPEGFTITTYENVLIYGAQVVAYGIFVALKEVYGIHAKSFVVSETENNPERIEGIPVQTIENIKYDNENTVILIGTSEILHEEIMRILYEKGYENFICVDARLEHMIMSEYFRKINKFPLLSDFPNIPGARTSCPQVIEKYGQYARVQGDSTIASLPGDFTEPRKYKSDTKDLRVYMVKSHFDKPLKNHFLLPEWVIPIQAGAALTDRRVAEYLDMDGENISVKNRNYCELTVTYWVWKNTRHPFKGICHYRRMLKLNQHELEALLSGDIDAVLPLPYICFPDTKAQWGRFVPAKAWEAVETVLRETSPKYLATAEKILPGRFIYNYNMLIAKAEVFDAYCEWMMPILEKAEQIYETEAEIRQDRAMAYAGEVLTALFFLHHENDLRIRHAEKICVV